MALGAAPFVGVSLNVWASRFVATLLYGVESRDPVTLVPGWDSGCYWSVWLAARVASRRGLILQRRRQLGMAGGRSGFLPKILALQ